MPLSPFSRILPSKSPVGTRQYPAEDHLSLPVSPSPKGSKRSKSLHLRRKKDIAESTSGSTKTKESRTFAFPFDSFNVFGSFRTRRKLEATSSRSIYNHSVYSGYEDEEYGEPEALAEEIRRPSGLGRRASIAEMMNITDQTCSTHCSTDLGTGTGEGDSVIRRRRDDTARISEESYNESLVDIRYPSGLGNFKPVINVLHTERPLSTYPIFVSETRFSGSAFDGMSLLESSCSPNTSTSQLPCLAGVIPLLGPYLCPRTLFSLTLVDHAVAEPSKEFLWKSITLEGTLPPTKKDEVVITGRASRTLLDILSTRRELASLVRSLVFNCNCITLTRNTTTPRPRPPPLLLSPVPPTVSRRHGPRRHSTNLHTAPLFRDSGSGSSKRPSTAVEPSRNEDKDRPIFKIRRASSFLPSTLNLKTKLPEAWQSSPQSKLQPPSSHKRHSVGLTGQNTAPVSPISPRSTTTTNGDAGISPFKAKFAPGQSNWTPPPEWQCHKHSCVPSPAGSFSFSPSPSPSPSAYARWSPSKIRSKPSLPSLKTGVQIIGSSSNPSPLRTSPSLPSLHSPTTPSGFLDYSVSQATTPPSPLTPFSPVSLSAFPLPPLSTSAPPRASISPLTSSAQDNKLESLLSPSPGSGTSEESSQKLASAFTNLVHLTHVTLHFTVRPTSAASVSSGFSTRPGGNSEDTPEIDDAIKTLKDFLLKLKSLQRLKVVCAAGQEAFHRARWSVLKDDLEVEIACTS